MSAAATRWAEASVAANRSPPAYPPARAAQQEGGAERHEQQWHDQATRYRAADAGAADEGQQAAEPELPTPTAARSRANSGDEQERHTKAERAEAAGED